MLRRLPALLCGADADVLGDFAQRIDHAAIHERADAVIVVC